MTKEALKLALEALEAADWYIDQLEMIVYCVDDEGTHENRSKVQAAIAAIKEALSQPQQEPVACKTLCELCIKRGYTFCANAVKTTPIYTTPQH